MMSMDSNAAIWILMLRLLPSCTVWNKSLWLRKNFPGSVSGKELACQCRRHREGVQSLGGENPLEEGMATHSSILVWTIPWTEEPGRLQSMGLPRVGNDRGTEHLRLPQFYLSFFFFFFQVRRLAQRSWLAKGSYSRNRAVPSAF